MVTALLHLATIVMFCNLIWQHDINGAVGMIVALLTGISMVVVAHTKKK